MRASGFGLLFALIGTTAIAEVSKADVIKIGLAPLIWCEVASKMSVIMLPSGNINHHDRGDGEVFILVDERENGANYSYSWWRVEKKAGVKEATSILHATAIETPSLAETPNFTWDIGNETTETIRFMGGNPAWFSSYSNPGFDRTSPPPIGKMSILSTEWIGNCDWY